MKYHNIKTFSNGIKYDSKKEARRGDELRLMEKAGLISDLERQKRFVLQEGFTNNKGEKIRPITYIADFYYKEKNWIAEDVKSSATKTEVYKIKKKLFEFKYPEITFRES